MQKKYHEGEEGKLFLRWVNFFYKHLNDDEKRILERYIPNIEANIEDMYDEIVWKDIKQALKEINALNVNDFS